MDSTTSERRFPPHPVSDAWQLADVRAEFAGWLSSLVGDAEARVREVAVVLSELGSNAIEATPKDGPPAEVAAWMDHRRCTLEVVNHLTTDHVDVVAWDLDDPLRTRGRGMMLVAALSDDVQVHADGDRVTIRCVASIPDGS